MLISKSQTLIAETEDGFTRGLRLQQSGRTVEALQCYQSLLEIRPSDINVLINTAAALHDLERYHEALDIYNHAIEIAPASGILHHNRGNTLLAMDLLHEAVASYSRAADLLPASAEPLVPMGTALERLGRYKEAMEAYQKALLRVPDCAEAHWNVSLLQLLTGNYAEGWKGFEWRWLKKGFTSIRPALSQPEWDGSPLQGKTILVYAEQGLGDAIQFARFLPLLSKMGARIILKAPQVLHALFRQLPSIIQLIDTEQPLPFDTHIALLSLPLLLGIRLHNITNRIPYLEPPEAYRKKWQGAVPKDGALNVGIAWQGRKKPDPSRSCPSEQLSVLANSKDVRFFSLQLSENGTQPVMPVGVPIVDLTADIADFCDTAALMEQLDLVITIDTSVAHLAGSLALPTWLLLPFAPDWRWMLGRDDSPWYPSMRIFRQPNAGDWGDVLSRVQQALHSPPNTPVPDATKRYRQQALDYYQHGAIEKSEEMFRTARESDKWNRTVAEEMALLLNEQGRFHESIGLISRQLSGAPGDPCLSRLLGESYQNADHPYRAYLYYQRAVRAFPDDPLLHMNLGIVCDAMNQPLEALKCLARARELAPDAPQILLNLGGVLQGMNLLDDAASCLREALRLDPGYAGATWNLAQILLLKESYSEGFSLFDARFHKRDPVPQSPLTLPFWSGEPLEGRTIAVTTEQAFGDAIQFCRYAPLLSAMGARVVILNHLQPLQSLLESVPGVAAVVSRPDQVVADLQVPMLSLPHLCRTGTDNIPDRVPYLAPSHEKTAEWSSRIPLGGKLRIGIVWAGRQLPDPRRSAALDDFIPVAQLPGIQLVSLQLGPGADELAARQAAMNILDLTPKIRTFEDTAGLIANLDLIISVDTAVAHLAGAMGKPVWLLLPFAPDWRWLLGRSDSPWYPTMRIFRQEVPGEWGTVIRSVVAGLSCLAV